MTRFPDIMKIHDKLGSEIQKLADEVEALGNKITLYGAIYEGEEGPEIQWFSTLDRANDLNDDNDDILIIEVETYEGSNIHKQTL